MTYPCAGKHQGMRARRLAVTSLRRRLMQLAAATMLAGAPMVAQAETITFPGDMLNTDPWGNADSLFSASSLTDNRVSVTGGTIGGNVYGGVTAGNDDVSTNSVGITGGTVQGDIYGGYSESGNAIGNSVSIKSGVAGANVLGGYSLNGAVTGNSVSITDGTVTYTVYGGNTLNFGSVTGNSVLIEGGAIGGGVYGGSSRGGDIIGNSVLIKGGTVTYFVIGGFNYDATVSGNNVSIEGGMVGESVYGGSTMSGTATDNSVSIKDGTINGSVYGGYGFGNDITDNKVSIEGGTIYGDVYGGRNDYTGAATGNSVTIAGGTLQGSVYGGFSDSGSATGNSVTISGTPQFNATDTALYGGYKDSGTGDVFTGNTLNFSAHPVTVKEVANFQTYNFTIDPAYANSVTALISADTITLGDGSGTPSTIAVVGIHSGNALNVNDKLVLMQAASLTGDGIGQTTTGVAQQGISLLYDVRTDIDLANNQVTATILGDDPVDNGGNGGDGGSGGPAARVNPQLKALSEGYLSGLMLTTRGADLVANELHSTITRQNKGGLSPFILISASHNRYNSGSHIKSNDFLVTTGVSYRQKDFTLAAFIEAGWGNYDSYNSFYNAASVRGDGNNHYLGGGLFGRYEFGSGLYAEASFRAGQSRSKFDTNDIQNLATGEFAHYNLKSPYMSAHVGAGYLWTLSEANTLDLSAKYLWSRLGSKNAVIGGDSFRFDSINSQRVRLNCELKHRYSDNVTLFAGLGYEYEFDAEAKATTYGVYRIDAPKLKEATGILSLGATITSAADKNLSFDVRAQGYVGKREGGSATARVNYTF